MRLVVYWIATKLSSVQQDLIPAYSTNETLRMTDSEMGTRVSFPTRGDETRDALFTAVDDSLANFFKRPINIATYTWTPLQGAPFTAIFDPWSLFLQNPRVINRINNYQLLRCKMHVKFLINGNGFYYGRLMADYAPLLGGDQIQSYSTLVSQNAIAASQRMKVFIDPGGCCSNQMELPFVWHYDALNIPLAEWSAMGSVYIRELSPLKHANGSVQPITITVMAWAEDVQLAVPTSTDSSAIVAQAGEEYAKPGPLENVASAVASVASKLKDVPVVGPYARATSMAAGAFGKVAGAMGWSRPPVILPLDGMRPTFISALAPGDAGDNTQKLTVDSKQELTVDPNVIGIALEDELNIAGIAARESYLTSFAWTTARTAGDMLFTSRVNPMLNASSGGSYYLPASAFATLPFQFWRGRVRFRFQIVASAHHKGRLRFVFDPQLISSVETNVQYTRFIDIGEDRDFTMEVDWAQTPKFLPCPTLLAGSTAYRTTVPFPTVDGVSNGALGVYVLNDLATPNSTVNNDITINVYVSTLDLEVASPSYGFFGVTNSYTATVQAGEEAPMANDLPDAGCGTASSDETVGAQPADNHKFEVFFGENVVNFRQLLHRYMLHSSYTTVNSSAGAPSVWNLSLPQTPFPYGYNSLTVHTTTGAKKFNYVNVTLLQYLMQAFATMRGSQRSKYVVTPAASVASVTARRTSSGWSVPATATVLSQASQSAYGRAFFASRDALFVGGATTPAEAQPVLEVEYPFQKNVRFDYPRIADISSTVAGAPYSYTQNTSLLLNPGTNPVTMDRYVSIGEDFGLYWFQGCPPLSFTAPPA